MKKTIFFLGLAVAFLMIFQEELVMALKVAGVIILGAVVPALGFLLLLARERFLILRAKRIEEEKKANVMVVTTNGQTHIRDTDHKASWTALHLDPRIYSNGPGTQSPPTPEEVAAWQLFNMPRISSSAAAPALLPPVSYPPNVNLMDLLPNGASLHNVVLGLHIRDDGTREVIREGMTNMVHVAVGGSSGWGKSIFLRSLAYQAAIAPELCELSFIDLESMTFTPFGNSNKLRYPIVDNGRDALAILADLSKEMESRKALFSKFPTVENLDGYNAQAANPLPFILLFADEITALLKKDKAVEAVITQQILRARKYGIFAIFGGQSWKADVMDTTIRSQFSSTVHFHAKDKSSSRVLLGTGDAARITEKGRAFAILPGRPIVEMMAPMITLMAAAREMSGRAPAIVEMPRVEPTPKEAKVLTMFEAGATVSAIAIEVEGDKGGPQNRKVRAILDKFGKGDD